MVPNFIQVVEFSSHCEYEGVARVCSCCGADNVRARRLCSGSSATRSATGRARSLSRCQKCTCACAAMIAAATTAVEREAEKAAKLDGRPTPQRPSRERSWRRGRGWFRSDGMRARAAPPPMAPRGERITCVARCTELSSSSSCPGRTFAPRPSSFWKEGVTGGGVVH